MTEFNRDNGLTIESLLEENSKLNMALNYFFLRDPDKPTSWEYNRSQAEELARAALEPDQYLTGGYDGDYAMETRMVEITLTYLVDVEAESAYAAEDVAQAMVENYQIDLADPTSYTIKDRGAGSWND